MAASNPVGRFIEQNNDDLDQIKDLLDTATNQALPPADRDKALAAAGHKACRALQRLEEADQQLWQPLRQHLPTVIIDPEHVLHFQEPERYPAPCVPVTPELLQLLHHPRPDEAANLIALADRLLADAVQEQSNDLETLVEQAQSWVSELRRDTCVLSHGKAPWTRRLDTVRGAAKAIALGSLTALAIEVQERAWQVAPDLAPQLWHRAIELLQQLGYTLDALPWLGAVAVVAVAREAVAVTRAPASWRAGPAVSASPRESGPAGSPSVSRAHQRPSHGITAGPAVRSRATSGPSKTGVAGSNPARRPQPRPGLTPGGPAGSDRSRWRPAGSTAQQPISGPVPGTPAGSIAESLLPSGSTRPDPRRIMPFPTKPDVQQDAAGHPKRGPTDDPRQSPATGV